MNKLRLKKVTPKISIEAINTDNDELLFEITERNWSNLGEVFNDHYFTMITQKELKGEEIPKNITLIAVSEFKQQ